MASFNKVIIIGNVTAAPELKTTPNGVSVTSFTVAVNRRFSGDDGEKKTDYISIVAWRNTAEFVVKYFKKGSPILVCGQLQTRSWTDGNGAKRYVTEVVADEISFVGSIKENGAETKSVSKSAELKEIDDNDDLPF